MKFYTFLNEQKNTLAADVNEILVGYYALGGTWKGFQNTSYVKKQLENRKNQIPIDEYNDQMGRAQVMVHEILKWARSNGYSGSVKRVWWTARPGELSKAVDQKVDSRKNPTDTLFQFTDGGFLGISAKSTKGKGDIGFKNPGIGTINKALKLNLTDIQKKMTDDAVDKLDLPKNMKERKKYIRDNANVKTRTQSIGDEILSTLRDTLFKTLNSLSQKDMKDHIFSHWMDVDDSMFPYYIKATGHGKNGKYTAKISDPLNNPKANAISSGNIEVMPIGTNSIGVTADGNRIMKMRFKYESEKIASSVKLSGDPW